MEQGTGVHLKWNMHQNIMLAVFEALLTNEKLTDCTVSAEGQYLRAHKLILAACSPYFEQLFSENYEKHPIIILPDVKFRVIKAVLDFMYHGEVNVQDDDLGSVLKLADSFQIRGLCGSRYIDEVGTQGGEGRNQLLVSPENDSTQPTISSVFTLRPQEPNGIETPRNSFEQNALLHLLQEHNSSGVNSVSRMDLEHENGVAGHGSSGDAGLIQFREACNAGTCDVYQISDVEEVLPELVNIAAKSGSRAVSDLPRKSQLQGSANEETNIKRDAQKDTMTTVESVSSSKTTLNKVVYNERALHQVSPGTKSADLVVMPVGAMKDLIVGGNVDTSGSVTHTDVNVTTDQTVKDGSINGRRKASVWQTKLRNRCRKKLHSKFKCHMCWKSYMYHAGLVRHLMYECGIEPQFKCPHCDKRCARPDLLKGHMLSHRCQNYLRDKNKKEDGQLQGSANKATNIKRGAQKDPMTTAESPLSRKITLNQIVCSERALHHVSPGTKSADLVDMPMGAMKDLMLGVNVDASGSVIHTDVNVTTDQTVKDGSISGGRKVSVRQAKLRTRRRKKLHKKFKCHVCWKSYMYHAGLVRHLMYECGVEPQFQCPRCDKHCARPDLLKKHMLTRRCQNYLQDKNKEEDGNK